MPYSAEISRANPTCFLLLIDQSGSMADTFPEPELPGSKAEQLARAVNRILQELILKCAKETEIYRYFQVGVIGYGSTVGPSLGGSLAGKPLVWVDELYKNPLRIEVVAKKVPDGAGGLVDQTTRMPVWFDSVASNGTPMSQAFDLASGILRDWTQRNASAFPPILINITDGASTDGDPIEIAEEIQSLFTADGNVLTMNLHLSSSRVPAIKFPDNRDALPDQYAQMLFDMSSVLPPFMRETAAQFGYNTSEQSRAFVLNADIIDVIAFLNIGTRPSNLR